MTQCTPQVAFDCKIHFLIVGFQPLNHKLRTKMHHFHQLLLVFIQNHHFFLVFSQFKRKVLKKNSNFLSLFKKILNKKIRLGHLY